MNLSGTIMRLQQNEAHQTHLFFHDRPWISPWIKTDIQRVRYHFSYARVTIIQSIWRHRQSIVPQKPNVNRASEARGRWVKLVDIYRIDIYGFVMSSKK